MFGFFFSLQNFVAEPECRHWGYVGWSSDKLSLSEAVLHKE